MKYIMFFDEIRHKDIPLVGGKSANLGEMTTQVMVPVPYGFATTADAYLLFIKENNLWEKIKKELDKVKDYNDTKILSKIGKKIRKMIVKAKIPKIIKKEVEQAYSRIGKGYVSVRSSATAEDLPGASFAGQQETYLNINGGKKVIQKIKECYSSLFTDRAIFYRFQKGFNDKTVALSAIVQRMIHSKSSGVMFTIDVRDGDTSKIVIEGSYGLGEYIVKGEVTPDSYFVRKTDLKIIEKNISRKLVMLTPTVKGVKHENVPKDKQTKSILNDNEIIKLAKYALALEKHYKIPQDIEWAKDEKGNLYILQTRPETAWVGKKKVEKQELSGEIILKGLPASPGIGFGKAKIIKKLEEIYKINNGDVLVTGMTNPDMVPAMRKATAIVTNEGGMTSHAAIVSRELGIPCVVGSTNGTEKIKEEEMITVDGSTGNVYDGKVTGHYEGKIYAGKVPKTETKIYVNIGIPEIADAVAKKPSDGIGLMREEFIIATHIKDHPMHMFETGKEKEFIEKLSQGIEKVVKAFYPRPVILRFSDFKTNEYKDLKGGSNYEPHEDNPMIGWRGCSRYISEKYEPAFRMELKAVKKVRQKYKNLNVMLPFARNIDEVKKITQIMKEEGIERSKSMKLYLMAEIPSNIFLADLFSQYCDGFSIGSNDLTQLILGCDRDSEVLGKMGEFDERNLAVKRAIVHLIKTAHKYGKTVGICGQAPSQYPEFAKFLVDKGIDSISVNPDVVEKTRFIVAEAEKNKKQKL